MIRDPMTGRLTPAQSEHEPGSNRVRLALPRAEFPARRRLQLRQQLALGASVDVRTEVLPRVEEIIFRHQQAQAAQDDVLQTYIGTCANRAAIPSVGCRSGLQRRDRKPALLRSRRRGVGGIELRAEWREVDIQSAAVSARAAREGPVAAARSAAESGLRVPARRRRHGRRTVRVRRPVRSDSTRQRALSRQRCGSIVRPSCDSRCRRSRPH